MAPAARSPARILEIARRFWDAKALSAAVEIDLFTALAGKAFSDEAAAEATGASLRGMRALTPSLASLGLLRRSGAGRWRLSAEAEAFLVRGKPGYVGDYVLLCGGRMYRNWTDIAASVRNGEPRAPTTRDSSFEAMAPEEVRRFTLGMHGMSQDAARRVFRAVPLASRRRLVDVGGGSGAYLHEALRRHRRLEGVLFDRAPVLEVAETLAVGAGLATRMRFVPGDFFRDDLPGGDALLLSKVLHDWRPERNRALLARCRDALEPGGVLLVAEWFLDDDRAGPKEAALGSLNMLVETEGENYTWREYEAWAREAGFARPKRIRLKEPGVVNGVLVCPAP